MDKHAVMCEAAYNFAADVQMEELENEIGCMFSIALDNLSGHFIENDDSIGFGALYLLRHARAAFDEYSRRMRQELEELREAANRQQSVKDPAVEPLPPTKKAHKAQAHRVFEGVAE